MSNVTRLCEAIGGHLDEAEDPVQRVQLISEGMAYLSARRQASVLGYTMSHLTPGERARHTRAQLEYVYNALELPLPARVQSLTMLRAELADLDRNYRNQLQTTYLRSVIAEREPQRRMGEES